MRYDINGSTPLYLTWTLAGPKHLCDNKRYVTLTDVILLGFDCSYVLVKDRILDRPNGTAFSKVKLLASRQVVIS